MKVFNMALFGWPYLPQDAVGPCKYPVSNAYFDPEIGYELFQKDLDLVQLTDELGLDGFNCQEHHGAGGFCAFVPSTEIIAAAVSQRTKNIKIALTGSCIPLHHPLAIAEQVAQLDHLSGGRIIWGALRGFATEYISYNVNPAESQERFREGFDLILKAWTHEGPFDFDGKYYRVRNYNIWPRTLQQPHPPIWMAANSHDTLDFAIKRNTYVATPFVSCERTRETWTLAHQISDDLGIPLVEDFDDWFASVCVIYVADNDERAREEAQEALDYHFFTALGSMDLDTTSLIPGHMSVKGLKSWLRGSTSKNTGKVIGFPIGEAIDNGTAIIGTPETCVELAKRQKEHGKRNVLLAMFQFGNLPQDKAAENLRLFATKVYPEIRHF